MQNQVIEDRLDKLALAWLWCQGDKAATPAAVATGVKAMLPSATTPAETVASTLARLVTAGEVERIEAAKKGAKPTYKTSASGARRAMEFLGRRDRPGGSRPFGALASYDLPALAAGLTIPAANKKEQAAFGKLLPVAVSVRHHRIDVPLDKGPDAAKVALVKLALSRAGGVAAGEIHLKKLPGGELPALVVGPLLGQPRTAATNIDKLLAEVANGCLGITKAAQLKAAVVRQWLTAENENAPDNAGPVTSAPADAQSLAKPPPERSGAVEVDLPTFIRQLHAAVADVARNGGAGVSNLRDKVLVNAAWRRYEQLFEPIPIDQFKRRTLDAGGSQIDLVREDLIPVDRAAEFHEAEVRAGASTYHYIRVRD